MNKGRRETTFILFGMSCPGSPPYVMSLLFFRFSFFSFRPAALRHRFSFPQCREGIAFPAKACLRVGKALQPLQRHAGAEGLLCRGDAAVPS